MKIRVCSLLDFSTIDWPGHITFMLFCSGCNFRCPFCMNAPLIPLDSGDEIELEMITERVMANIGFLDAIGATGGEPGLQPEAIIDLYTWAKKRGIKTFLNTNGSNPEFIGLLLNESLIDHIAIDVKAPLIPDIYRKVIGINEDITRILSNIIQTLEICKQAQVSVEVRTTVVPKLIDDEQSIRKIAGIAKDYNTYVLQQFFPSEEVLDKKLRSVNPPDRTMLAKLARFSLEEGVREVFIRTREGGMEKIELC